MEPMTIRALERILIVLIGGLCVYLGYRLFLNIPKEKDGEGKINLPGGVSIFVTRVGPGVFFALFGTGVVALSLYQAVTYSRGSAPDPGGQKEAHVSPPVSSSESVYYRGITFNRPQDEVNKQRLRLHMNIEFLNNLPSVVRRNLADEQRRELDRMVRSTKLELMKMAWGSDWGDFDQFALWVEAGAPNPVPNGLEAAAGFYLGGQGGIE